MTVRHLTLTIAAALGLAVSLSACGGGSSTPSASQTLRTAFSADPSPLDPDTYYEAEGLAVTTSTYQRLLRYAPNSTQLEGELATKWEASADGRTYTFTLKHGVRFSDGTSFDAAAAKASLERRIALKGGPSYMLAEVASISTPAPDRLVVRLKKPQAPFLSLMASPYGPLMSSPTAVRRHTVHGDHAHAWLSSHTAGTGPYQLAEVQRSVRYVLKSNPHYQGPHPYFTTIQISVVPSFATQRLELQGGQLDLVLHGLSTQDVLALSKDPNMTVEEFPALFKAEILVNPASAALGSAKARAALRASLNNQQLTSEIFGPRAVPSKDVLPAGMLPAGAAPDSPRYDPAALKTGLGGAKGKRVVIGWYSDGAMQRLADLLQVRLQQAGLNAVTREYKPSLLFALPTKPSQRPDLMATVWNPDSVDPNTFPSVYWGKTAPVNLMGCSSSAGDALTAQSTEAVSPALSRRLAIKAADAYRASNCFLNVSDVRDTIVARKGITGGEHELPWVFDVRFATLRRG